MRHKAIIAKFFSTRGFGFAHRENEPDVFIHVKELRHRESHWRLGPGVVVEFNLTHEPKGWRALDITILGE